MFNGFPKGCLPFLEKIARNNTKEWFDAHKNDYETLILEPSRDFVVEMGEHLQALVPTINAEPKINGSLFRIYRDSRFHARKDPIKTRIGIIFWQGRGRRMASACFYLHFDPRTLLLAAGIRKFKPDMLAAYREYIKVDAHRESLHTIITELQAEGFAFPPAHYKRYPRGFSEAMKHGYLALYDCMYAYIEIGPEAIFSSEFPDRAFGYYEAMFALQQWVYAMTLTYEPA